MFISNILNSILIGILFVEMLERRFPEQFQRYMINLSYYCIYSYSKCQIWVNQYIMLNPIVVNAINMVTQTNNKKCAYTFVTIEHQNVICSSDLKLLDQSTFVVATNYDHSPPSKKIAYKDNYNNAEYEKSNTRFILIEFTVGEKTYKIDLLTEQFNYYIVGNVFSKDFFMFYVQCHMQEQCQCAHNDKCWVKLIDNDVNILNVDFTDKLEMIELNKNGYKIITFLNHNKSK